MPNEAGTLLRDDAVVPSDDWIDLADDVAAPAAGKFTVSLQRFTSDPGALGSARGRLGIRLGGEDDARSLAGMLDGVTLLAVRFAKFTDGRGYSTARLLRDELAYRGELRAVGDILPDQVFYLRRCGFDALVLAAGKNPDHALAALKEFSVTYQAAADDKRPLYRRTHR